MFHVTHAKCQSFFRHGFPKGGGTNPQKGGSTKIFSRLEITHQDNGLQGIGNVEKRADFRGGNRMISGRIHNYFDKGED